MLIYDLLTLLLLLLLLLFIINEEEEEIGSPCVAQPDLELMILQPQTPEYQYSRCAPSQPARVFTILFLFGDC